MTRKKFFSIPMVARATALALLISYPLILPCWLLYLGWSQCYAFDRIKEDLGECCHIICTGKWK